MPSVLEQIRKLDEQKTQLLQSAKQEALDKANAAIRELEELGFHYRLAEGGGGTIPSPRSGGGGRRTGIRDQVLSAVKEAKAGITRAQLLDAMSARGDKSAEQSISNALAALKKAGTITGEGGTYEVA